MQTLRDKKTEWIAEIITNNTDENIDRLLGVGCGSGIEAAILAQCLDTQVVGIDVVKDFDPDAMAIATLQLGDAMALDFDDCSFDFVYSFHALEHISDPIAALREMHRVLKAGGGYWFGAPNRSRAIGYVGSKQLTLAEKIQWNLTDWKARLAGKFTNEMGAHAGFTSAEFRQLISSEFSTINNMSDVYYATLYSNHRQFLSILRKSRLSKIAYPSVYFMGRK